MSSKRIQTSYGVAKNIFILVVVRRSIYQRQLGQYIDINFSKYNSFTWPFNAWCPLSGHTHLNKPAVFSFRVILVCIKSYKKKFQNSVHFSIFSDLKFNSAFIINIGAILISKYRKIKSWKHWVI